MEMPKNHFKRAIQSDQQQLGLWCSIQDAFMAEMMAGIGYDWILLDTEHTTMNPMAVAPMLQAIAAYDTQAVVRPPVLDAVEIKKLLDAGAQSILVPYVETAEQARLAVSAVTYPPEGVRGVAGLTRASRFGAVKDYHRHAREELCLLLQIETVKGLENLEEIASVEGVDGIFIGPSDLAASLGHLGDPAHPDVRAACADAIGRVRAVGKPAGFLSLNQEFVAEMIEAGSLFTAVDIDNSILRRGAVARLNEWKERLGE